MTSTKKQIEFCTASIDISPSHPVSMAGKCKQDELYTKVAIPLEANAVLINGDSHNLIIVSLDLLYAGPLIRKNLLDKFGSRIRDEELFICASHTHFAPSSDPTKPLLGKTDELYIDFLLKRLEQLVDKLLRKSSTIGTLHYGEQFASHSINRRPSSKSLERRRRQNKSGVYLEPNAYATRDEKIRTLIIKDQNEKICLVIWNYACHPVNFPREEGISSEYPGSVRQCLRSKYEPELPVIFMQGFSGDIRPFDHSKQVILSDYIRSEIMGSSFPIFSKWDWQAWCNSLFEKVDDAIVMAINNCPILCRLSASRCELSLDKILSNPPETGKLSVAVIGIGPEVQLLGISAEPVVDYGPLLDKYSFGKYTIPVGCIDQVYGYLPKSEMIGQGGYEDSGYFQYFSIKGEFKPNIQETIVETVQELVENVDESRGKRIHSTSDLVNGIERLGVERGDLVLVRAALGMLGNVEGRRSSALLNALIDAVGPEGTIVSLAFNSGLSLPWVKKLPTITQKTKPFSGGLVVAMLGHQDAIRSLHPTNSFVAIGPKAEELTRDHDENAYCFAPMEKLLDWDAKMILVGCTEVSPGFSTVHFAEAQLGHSFNNINGLLLSARYEREGTVHVFRRRDVPGCSKGFSAFYPHYIHRGLLKIAHVGDAYSYGITARDAFGVEYQILKGDALFTLCNNPTCRHCRGALTYNLREWPVYYSKRMKVHWHNIRNKLTGQKT